MKRLATLASVTALALGSLAFVAPTAAAADRTCRGELSNIIVSGTVYVPSGATCNLTNVAVRGDVKLGTASNVRIYGRGVFGNVQGESAPGTIVIHNTRIYGNVQTKGAWSVRITRAKVNGDVQAERNLRQLYVANAAIGGNVQTKYMPLRIESTSVGGDIQHVEGRTSFIVRNRVAGNVQVFKNRLEQRVSYNTISGNLQCKENVPRPVGGKNTVSGSKEDQCRRL